MSSKWDESNEILSKKMSEYAWAVLNGRPAFHVSLIIDVSPNCDCESENDIPVIPDVGMYASFDPIALDQACVDAVNEQKSISGSVLGSVEHNHKDHFKAMHPDSEWEAGLVHGEKLGIGTRQYELITVK